MLRRPSIVLTMLLIAGYVVVCWRIHDFIVVDSCLDAGGTIRDGSCVDSPIQAPSILMELGPTLVVAGVMYGGAIAVFSGLFWFMQRVFLRHDRVV